MTALGQNSGALPLVWEPFVWKQEHLWFSFLSRGSLWSYFPFQPLLSHDACGGLAPSQARGVWGREGSRV